MASSGANDDAHETFQMIALLGPAAFLERLIPVEKADTEYLRFNETNSRDFLLLRVLVEVQKAGFTMERWRKLAAGEKLGEPRETYSNNLRVILESIADEQSLWQRKLTEALALLIGFSTTNAPPYYYHFLLLHDLQRQIGKVKEAEQFFGGKSEASEQRRDEIVAKIAAVEQSLGDLSVCWYLDQGNKKQRRLASFSRQLRYALTVASPLEKNALGYTYGKGYSVASSSIHLSALRPEYLKPEIPFHAGFAFCGLLTVAILGRAHSLTGMVPGGINRRLAPQWQQFSGTDPSAGIAKAGDFVLVDGLCLGVVEEVVTGPYGYEAYRVKYLDERPSVNVTSDWYSAFDVCHFQSKEEALTALQQVLADFRAQGLPALEPPPTHEELDEALVQGTLEAWRRGVREYLQRNAVARIAERGEGKPEPGAADV